MTIMIPEADDIYFAKTREYFREVLSSYASGNYRSAIVMLYSIAICDILFKLEELKDMYNDSVATSILDKVENIRNNNQQYSKSSWEKELIDEVRQKTSLLDLEAYTHLNHLYDYRNFSAHPALNDNYELVSPSQETVIACIKNTIKDILVKPPFFIKNIIDVITDDLEGQIDVYKNRKEILESYLNKKYFSKMTVPMKLKLFQTFWKFCFILTDEKCCQNRTINRMALLILCKGIEQDIEDYVEKHKEFFYVKFKKSTLSHLIVFLDSNTYIYKHLSEETKLKIDRQLERNYKNNLVTWFKFSNFNDYFDHILNLDFIEIDSEMIDFITEHMRKYGEIKRLLDYYITNFGKSTSYPAANESYFYTIKPFIDELNRDQVIALIESINSNSQIFHRYNCYSENTKLIRKVKGVLGKEFDYSKYDRFEFDEDVLIESNEKDTIEEYL